MCSLRTPHCKIGHLSVLLGVSAEKFRRASQKVQPNAVVDTRENWLFGWVYKNEFKRTLSKSASWIGMIFFDGRNLKRHLSANNILWICSSDTLWKDCINRIRNASKNFHHFTKLIVKKIVNIFQLLRVCLCHKINGLSPQLFSSKNVSPIPAKMRSRTFSIEKYWIVLIDMSYEVVRYKKVLVSVYRNKK